MLGDLFKLAGHCQIQAQTSIIPYLNRCRELSVLDGCVLWGSRVVIPPTGHDIILNQLHEAHPGVSRMKRLARCFVWWPGLDSAIENRVRLCEKCQTNRPLPPKAPLHPWEYPSRPWIRLHIDHAGPFLGHTFLIVVDAHSKWIESHIVNSTSSEATIKVLRNLFATHGIPEHVHVVSDNGSGFTSQDNSWNRMVSNIQQHHHITPFQTD